MGCVGFGVFFFWVFGVFFVADLAGFWHWQLMEEVRGLSERAKGAGANVEVEYDGFPFWWDRDHLS